MLLFTFPKIINQNHYNMFEGKKEMSICAKISNFQLGDVVCRLFIRHILKIYFFASKILTVCKKNQIFNWVALYAGSILDLY